MLPDFLLNKYIHQKLLSRSHFSSVYLAIQKSLGRKVVIKTLLSRRIDPSSKRPDSGIEIEDKANLRFEREGRILAQFDDPGVVKIYDFGQEQDTTFIVSEFVEGKSLKEILDAQKKIELREGLRIIKEIAMILSRVHNKSIFHRDIKPSNIIIKEDGSVKLIDFGLAQTLSLENITLSGEIIGTPAYMSPEQISCKPIDFRSDIFSLGVVAYELLNEENPFVADTISGVLNKVLNFRPRSISNNCPSSVSVLLDKMLAKNPEKRIQSCNEIARQIDQIMVTLKPDIDASVALNIRNKKRIRNGILWAATLVILIGFFFFMFYPRREQDSITSQKTPVTDHEVKSLVQDAITKVTEPESTLNREEVEIPITNRVNKKQPEELVIKKTIPNPSMEELSTRNIENTDAGYLKVKVEPWADIYINEEFKGQTPIPNFLRLTAETTKLRLSNPDIGKWETIINVKPNETLNIFINITDRFARLKVIADPWATIYVNGEEKGTTPLGKPIYLIPGKYELELKNPNFSTIIETVYLKSGEIKEKYAKFNQ